MPRVRIMEILRVKAREGFLMDLCPKLIDSNFSLECLPVIQQFKSDQVNTIQKDLNITYKDPNLILKENLVFHLMKRIHSITSSL